MTQIAAGLLASGHFTRDIHSYEEDGCEQIRGWPADINVIDATVEIFVALRKEVEVDL
jgi:hypothetical protein